MRLGRESNSPPQLGQRPPIASAQSTQKVHSKEQMRALGLSAASEVSQRSQIARISSAIVVLLLAAHTPRLVVSPLQFRSRQIMAFARESIRGSIPALMTPMQGGNVDERALRKLVAWQIEQGSHGLVPCGTTGESPTLSHEEHRRVTEICIE